MHGDEVPSEKGFRVVDKRRFDSSGNEKPESTSDSNFQRIEVPPVSEKPAVGKRVEKSANEVNHEKKRAPKEAIENEPPPAGYGAPSGIDFSSFVVFLAQQAAIQLGLDGAQATTAGQVDLVGAKQTIDILGILNDKTVGNLDTQEKALLTQALHELRIAFVQVQTAQTKQFN
jgi:hypothetical protein